MTNLPGRQSTISSGRANECTQLLQLLAKNPSAALRVFKLTSTVDEPIQATYKGRRPRAINRVNCEPGYFPPPQYTKVRICCLPTKYNITSTIPSARRRQVTDKYMCLSKEELESKAKCVDDLGHFNFDAILPAVYWKSHL